MSTNMKLTLAYNWTPSIDPSNLVYSEKLDGMRAFWNGNQLLSRQGKKINAPDSFLNNLPKNIMLDGELFLARGKFQECMSIVRRKVPDKRWENITYQIFDTPSIDDGILKRLWKLEQLKIDNPHVKILPHNICKNIDHLKKIMEDVESNGGEGIMLRNPLAPYRMGRTHDLLKVKSSKDAEAIVYGYENGKGKYMNKMGALLCKTADHRKIKIGTGFTDEQRENPPKIGQIITYKYFELTKDGNPRFPSFYRIREDLDNTSAL